MHVIINEITGMIVQQSLTIVQQSLARFFNSHWHEILTVAGTIL